MEDFEEKPCYFNGKFVPLREANINIRTHALQYATAAFGGMRAYYNEEKKNLFIFRVDDHYERLVNSGKILQMRMPLSLSEFRQVLVSMLREGNWRQNVYIRPFLYKKSLDLSPRFHNVEDGLAIYAIPLDDYLDTQRGLRACVSSWVRIHDTQIPSRAKVTGAYTNSALAKSEALQNGFDEAIFLDIHGNVCEGSAENIFFVQKGELHTPPISSSILEGITRKTVITLAHELGIAVHERPISRTELYTSEEIFFSGTGVQVAWLREIDHRIIGNGKIGPVTQKIQEAYFRVVTGKEDRHQNWLTRVY
ncbi:MAG: branched-chain amino acid transaminase [Leptospiraceae bacterium]|nr:branched-chain amino acid transaminase [Leptospiraceae bacterium]MDW8306127.1 branched-chain amino acid transaminase [Leptospiraceae bacterium]